MLVTGVEAIAKGFARDLCESSANSGFRCLSFCPARLVSGIPIGTNEAVIPGPWAAYGNRGVPSFWPESFKGNSMGLHMIPTGEQQHATTPQALHIATCSVHASFYGQALFFQLGHGLEDLLFLPACSGRQTLALDLIGEDIPGNFLMLGFLSSLAPLHLVEKRLLSSRNGVVVTKCPAKSCSIP